MGIRRIVTAQTSTGAVFVSDEAVAPITVGIMPGSEFRTMWGSDTAASLPSGSHVPPTKGWFPAADGYRFHVLTLAPGTAGTPGVNLAAGLAEARQKLPGLVEASEPGPDGTHRSNTVDFVAILSGEAWLELDDGKRTLVKAGDTVVQNGTRHAWRNLSDKPCVMAVTLVGARLSGSGTPQAARA